MAGEDEVTGISLRFKYGPQTVFLFVDRLATFSQISEQLLDALRECYPKGLLRSLTLPGVVPIPSKDEPCQVSFAAPKNPRDLAAGWKPLNTEDPETPSTLRLRENTALAFVIQTSDAMEDAPEFNVEIPTFEDDE